MIWVSRWTNTIWFSLFLSLSPSTSPSLYLWLWLCLCLSCTSAHTLLISLAKNAFPVKCKKEMMWCSPALTCNQSLPPSSYFCYFTARRHTAPSAGLALLARPLAVLGGVFQSLTLSHTFPHPRCLPLSLGVVLVVFVAAKSTKTGLLSQANSVKYLSNVKVHPVSLRVVSGECERWVWVYSLCTRYIPLWFLAFPLPQFPQFCRLSVCLLPCLVGIIKGNFLYIQYKWIRNRTYWWEYSV